MILFFFSFSSIDIFELFEYDWFLTALSPFNINFVQCICLLLFFPSFRLNLNQLMQSPKKEMHPVPAGMPSGCEALLKRLELTDS